MKKILFIILLIPLLLSAQPYQSPVGINSSYTALSSGATFTGAWEQIRLDYSWIIVTVKSNVASANNGLKIFQSSDGKTFNSVSIFSYAANDTTTNKYFVPITSGYVKVTYLNGATNQTTFSLTTVYQKGAILPTTSTGKVDVSERYFSGDFGAITVGTSAVPLSATPVTIAEVEITNNTPNSTLYAGYSGGITSSNGFPLAYRDTYRIKISNLNKIYLIGSTTIDVRYVYYNY